MAFRIPLAWYQLCHNKVRLAVAIAGIAFANVLMFMQLGFENSLYDSAVNLHEILDADIIMLSTKYNWLLGRQKFARDRLYCTLGFKEVRSAEPVYISNLVLTNLQTRQINVILAVGIIPRSDVVNLAAVNDKLPLLGSGNNVLFDELSKNRYGPIVEEFRAGCGPALELNGQRAHVVGLYQLGPSFGTDGSIITAANVLFRLDPSSKPNEVSIGLIKVKPGTDLRDCARMLDAFLPDDVVLMTHDNFRMLEQGYWRTNTPIGYVFRFGLIMGFIVGAVIVYQILFSDVSDHLSEYATLKAIGYANASLVAVIVQEAVLLAGFGFIPGWLASWSLYALTRAVTNLPLHLTLGRSLFVFVLTVIMCVISGSIAVRKISRLDPADIF